MYAYNGTSFHMIILLLLLFYGKYVAWYIGFCVFNWRQYKLLNDSMHEWIYVRVPVDRMGTISWNFIAMSNIGCLLINTPSPTAILFMLRLFAEQNRFTSHMDYRLLRIHTRCRDLHKIFNFKFKNVQFSKWFNVLPIFMWQLATIRIRHAFCLSIHFITYFVWNHYDLWGWIIWNECKAAGSLEIAIVIRTHKIIIACQS